MSGRHQPEHGADSACPICQGSGVRMGGDEYQTCPKCRGIQCSECGVFGLVTRSNGKLYCERHAPLPSFGWTDGAP